MYWREYRTYLHCALSFGVSESSAYQTIKWVENVLSKDGSLSLPGKTSRYLISINPKLSLATNEASEAFVKKHKLGE